MNRYYLLLILLFFLEVVYSQTPVADFTIPTSGCLQERIQINNTSTSGDEFAWDFCIGDFFEEPDVITNTVSGLGSGYGIEIVKVTDIWYGFIIDRSNKKVMRFDYGASPLNEPDITELNISPALFPNNPENISIIKFKGEWHAVFGYGANGGDIIRLDFGTSIENDSPDVVNLGNFGNSGRARNVELVEENGNLILVLTEWSNDKIWRINFRDSFDNTIDPATDIYKTATFSDLNRITGIDIKLIDGNYIVHAVSFLGTNVVRLNFGSSLLNSPANEATYNLSGLTSLYNIRLLRDGSRYFGVITSDSQPIKIYNFGNLSTTQTPSEIIYSESVPQLIDVAMFKYIGISYTYGTSGNILSNISNFYECSSSQFFSEEENPIISYTESINHEIDLVVSNLEGSDFETKTITISSNTAPDIDISTPFSISCINNPIEFTAVNSSGDIQSYDWDFGDGDDSTDENPTHAYTTPGTYEITLNVTDPDPCDNFTSTTIKIFDDPVGTFDSPAGVVCTNQEVTFTNTTPDNFEDNESFEWQIDGETVSTDRDLNYEFESGGTFEVKLITSIPGCSNETVEDFDVIAGPSPNFTVDDNCVGALFEFNNTTTGSAITSYSWDFDNGFMSSDEDPESFEYSDAGTYNVTLTTINASGCETVIEKPLTVYELPQVDFSNEISCEQAPTQFEDLSSIDNANIESWQWDFDDPSSTENFSTDQNPQHTFTRDGEFDVKLTTVSTFGCIDSLEQVVVVNQAPAADLSYDKICIGEEVQFQSESEAVPGEVLTSYAWDLGGEFSDEENPTATFDFAIDYDVSLTVTSQNLCTNTIDKTITVNPVPQVEFAVEDNCDNEDVHLYDITSVSGDPIASYLWDFDGLGAAVDSSNFFSFPDPGSYNVNLEIVTEGGCEYEAQQSVTVNASPNANFDVSSAFGAPPFEVTFTNQVEAEEYNWDFGDGETSNEANPSHIFIEQGSYEVQLAVLDANGCADTTSAIINALIPDLELELQQLTFVNNKLVLTVRNNGTLVIDSLKATVSLDDRVTLEEKVDMQLLPSGNPVAKNHTLSLNLTDRNIEYICVTLDSYLDGIEDSNILNNTKCHNFDSPIVFVNPFPNPAKDFLNIDIISEVSGQGEVKIINSKGKQVINSAFDGVRGRNEVVLDISELKDGVYYLEIALAGSRYTTRVAVSN